MARRKLEATRLMKLMDTNGDSTIDQDELARVISFQKQGNSVTKVEAMTILADRTHPDGVAIDIKDEL
jgi:Ca2+-binding EF-hand superfamily protein